MWIEPVWTRTKADVDLAERLALKMWSELTPQEEAAWRAGLIGCFNYDDRNRIEGNTEFLANILRAYGYGPNLGINKQWTISAFPTASELERIRANIQILIDTYYAQSATLPVSLEYPTHISINSVERVLLLIYEMIGRMEESFVHCGTMCCGQDYAF